MSEKRFILCQDDLGNYEIRYDDKVFYSLWEVAPILNKQQATIKKQESLIRKLSEKLEECGLVKINGDIVEWIDNNDENMVV